MQTVRNIGSRLGIVDETRIHSGEILFVKSVKDGIPNRDPLRDSDARRVFGGEDGRISLSDVSIKRDVRDYVQARYRDGGGGKSMFVFCREERVEGNRLLGREKLDLIHAAVRGWWGRFPPNRWRETDRCER